MPDRAILSLLERVKAATGPDRNIDRDLGCLPGGPIFRRDRLREEDGITVVAYFRHEDRDPVTGRTMAFASGPDDVSFVGFNDYAVPFYTASIDAALALVERVAPGMWWIILHSATKQVADLKTYSNPHPPLSRLPLAILAALLSLMAEGPRR